MVLYVGMVTGGPSLEMDHVIRAVQRLAQVASAVQASGDPGHDFDLDLVFDIPGPILPNPYEGIRTGSLSKKQRILQVQVAVPEGLPSDATEAYLDDALRQSVDLTEQSLRRRKLAWAVEPLRATVEEIITRKRAAQ